MTKRQQEVSAIVRKHRADILSHAERELGPERVGYSMEMRFYPGWDKPRLTLHITKLADGYCYVETSLRFHRKGHDRPKPRRL